MQFSAVVNTYNEETNIRRCLSSLSWADEVIIVDTGSTDQTVSIARQCGARIISHPPVAYVEPARNVGIHAAKGDWIVLLDADEEFPPSLISVLREACLSETVTFFRIPRKNIIFGKWIKHSGWWPDYQIRVFQKDAVTWSDDIHSIPATRGKGRDLDPAEENSIIHHHYQSISQFVDRMNRYTSIMASERKRKKMSFTPMDCIKMPSREFIQRYFVWEGYKDGVHGLALSLLQACSELVVILKVWELSSYPNTSYSLSDLVSWKTEEDRQWYHWMFSTRKRQTSNPIDLFYLRVKKILSLW